MEFYIQYVPRGVNQLSVDDDVAELDELMFDQACDSADGSWSSAWEPCAL